MSLTLNPPLHLHLQCLQRCIATQAAHDYTDMMKDNDNDLSVDRNISAYLIVIK